MKRHSKAELEELGQLLDKETLPDPFKNIEEGVDEADQDEDETMTDIEEGIKAELLEEAGTIDDDGFDELDEDLVEDVDLDMEDDEAESEYH